LWIREFGSDPGIVGRRDDVERHAVHRDRHHAAGIQGRFARGSDRVWVPLGMREQLTGQLRTLIANRRFRWLNMAAG
jgi:hypothetical protein